MQTAGFPVGVRGGATWQASLSRAGKSYRFEAGPAYVPAGAKGARCHWRI